MKWPLIVVLNADHDFLEMIKEFIEEEGYEVIILYENSTSFATILERKPLLVMIELIIHDPEAELMVLNKMRLHPQITHIDHHLLPGAEAVHPGNCDDEIKGLSHDVCGQAILERQSSKIALHAG